MFWWELFKNLLFFTARIHKCAIGFHSEIRVFVVSMFLIALGFTVLTYLLVLVTFPLRTLHKNPISLLICLRTKFFIHYCSSSWVWDRFIELMLGNQWSSKCKDKFFDVAMMEIVSKVLDLLIEYPKCAICIFVVSVFLLDKLIYNKWFSICGISAKVSEENIRYNTFKIERKCKIVFYNNCSKWWPLSTSIQTPSLFKIEWPSCKFPTIVLKSNMTQRFWFLNPLCFEQRFQIVSELMKRNRENDFPEF